MRKYLFRLIPKITKKHHAIAVLEWVCENYPDDAEVVDELLAKIGPYEKSA